MGFFNFFLIGVNSPFPQIVAVGNWPDKSRCRNALKFERTKEIPPACARLTKKENGILKTNTRAIATEVEICRDLMSLISSHDFRRHFYRMVFAVL